MDSPWNSFPRLRYGDEFLIVPGGHSGYDMKLIIKTPEPDYHYTLSARYPSDQNRWQMPVYFEKTLETHPKAHKIMGRGSVDFNEFVGSLVTVATPTISRLDRGVLPEGEFVPMTEQLINRFRGGEIDMKVESSLFKPLPFAEIAKQEFALGFPTVTGSGLVIHTTTSDYSVTFPPFETLEKRIERSATLHRVEEYIEPDEDGDATDI